MSSRTYRIVGLAALVLAASPLSDAKAIDLVRYDNLGTFTTPSLGEGGVTVTGSADINVLNWNGLGIVGGLADSAIDGAGNEIIRFDFNGAPVTSVSYHVPSAGQSAPFNQFLGELYLEAFGHDGLSLGTVFNDGVGAFSVSAEFGEQPISAFRLIPTNSDSMRFGQLRYVPAPLGDMTGDGMVGPDDYTEWANTFGEEFDSQTSLPADVNGDFMVGPEDYTLWANNFGMSLNAAPFAVPEPSALMLSGVAILLACMLALRQRERMII